MGLTRRKKKRTHLGSQSANEVGVGERGNTALPDSKLKVPACFILGRGQLNIHLQQLIKDLKSVYEPNTASNLKTTKKNSLKDFLHVAGPLGVSHCIIVKFSGEMPTLRFARFPHGPTFTFRVEEYSLTRDIISSQKRPKIIQDLHINSPLLILSQFNEQNSQKNEVINADDGSSDSVDNKITPRCLKLLSTMLQNMFPSLNVHDVKLKRVKRCVLFHYDPTSKRISLRHYCIKASALGIRKQVDRLSRHKVPALSKYDDISEYLMKENLSESEAEDLPEAHVTLPQELPGAGNTISQQSKIRLYEIGPRLTLSLVKIQESLFGGEVLYHKHVLKSNEEIVSLRKEKSRQINEKNRRRKQQELNVKRKEAEKELHRKRSLEGMQAKSMSESAQYSSDDDLEYYRKEVGAEPSQELMLSKAKRPKYDKPFRQNKQEFRSKVDGGNDWQNKGRFSYDKKRNFSTSNNDYRKNRKFDRNTRHSNNDRNTRHSFSKKIESKSKFNQSRKVSGGKVFRIRKN